jgi:hypothetical protein
MARHPSHDEDLDQPVPPDRVSILDISEEAHEMMAHAVDPNDSWQDFVGWKTIRSKGYEFVRLDGVIYRYGKHGLQDEVIQS